MDPLVRTALWGQKLLSRTSGLLVSAAFSALLVYDAAHILPTPLRLLCLAVLLGLLGKRVRVRLARLEPEDSAASDMGLFGLAVVLAFGLVMLLPGQLSGSAYPVVLLVLVLASAFAQPKVAAAVTVLGIALELALTEFVLERPLLTVWPHVALMCVFVTVNALVFRAEIARVRRLSRRHINGELEKLRAAARSYRLSGAASSVVSTSSHKTVPSGDPENLLRSSVEQVHLTLHSALEMLRGALDLNTVALLWRSDDDQLLTVRVAATLSGDLQRGAIRAGSGIFGAALASQEAVYVVGSRARGQLNYNGKAPDIGFASVLPIIEDGRVYALLVADALRAEPPSRREQDALEMMGRFIGRAIENERIFVQLERAKVEQGKLYRAVDHLSEATTEAAVIQAAVNSARDFAAFDFAAVTLAHGATKQHEICAVSGVDAESLLGARFSHNAGLVAMAVANRHPLPYRGKYESSVQELFSRELPPPDLASVLVLPLIVHGDPLGTLVLGSSMPQALGEEVRPHLEVLARHVAISLANARMIQRLEDLATTDGMTGLYNKRALTELGRQKIRSAERFGKPLSLLICDIDHFKKVNDTYGHDIGDEVIKGFGEVLKRVKRETDQVGRFGGEEFVLVCEETDAAGAMLLAERVRTELEGTTFQTSQGPLRVTCSVGTAQVNSGGRGFENLFKAADEALYVSKRNGRNRVTSWTPAVRGAAA